MVEALQSAERSRSGEDRLDSTLREELQLAHEREVSICDMICTSMPFSVNTMKTI